MNFYFQTYFFTDIDPFIDTCHIHGMYVLLGYLFALVTAACWTQNSIIYTFVGKRIGSGLGGLAVFTLIRGNFLIDFKKMKDKRSFNLLIAAALVGPVFGMLLALYAFS